MTCPKRKAEVRALWKAHGFRPFDLFGNEWNDQHSNQASNEVYVWNFIDALDRSHLMPENAGKNSLPLSTLEAEILEIELRIRRVFAAQHASPDSVNLLGVRTLLTRAVAELDRSRGTRADAAKGLVMSALAKIGS